MGENSRTVIDNKDDPTVRHPSSGNWVFLPTTSSLRSSLLGLPKSNLDFLPLAHELEQVVDPSGRPLVLRDSEVERGHVDLIASPALLPLYQNSPESTIEPFTDGWLPRCHRVGAPFLEDLHETNLAKPNPATSKNGSHISKSMGNIKSYGKSKEIREPSGYLNERQDMNTNTGEKEMDTPIDKQETVQDVMKDIPMMQDISLLSMRSSFSRNVLQRGNRSKMYQKMLWWKKQVFRPLMSSNTLWVGALAVAFSGVVFSVYRWHAEVLRNELLQLELSDKNEKLLQLMKQNI